MTDYPAGVQSTGQDGSDVYAPGNESKRLINTTTDISKRSEDEIDHLREADDKLNQNEPVGHDQIREPPAANDDQNQGEPACHDQIWEPPAVNNDQNRQDEPAGHDQIQEPPAANDNQNQDEQAGHDQIQEPPAANNDQNRQDEPAGHDQNQKLPAAGNHKNLMIISPESIPNVNNLDGDDAVIDCTADEREPAEDPESCYTNVKNYVRKYKYELIFVCIVVAIVLLIAFLTPAIVIPFKSPQSQKVNKTASIKPHHFNTISNYYGVLVDEINGFSNGKVTLATDLPVSIKATLVVTDELVTIHREYKLNTTILQADSYPFEFVFTLNNFNLEIMIEAESGGILSITLLRTNKYGYEYMMIQNKTLTLSNESLENFNYSSNESGFYRLTLRRYEGITGTLSIHASYNVCQVNQSYPLNCSIEGNIKSCEVDVPSLSSRYILLILNTYELHERNFHNVTITGMIQLADKENKAKLVMIGMASICGLIVFAACLACFVFILRKQFPGTTSSEYTPLIDNQ